jgi:putative ABC transport system permease protein
MKNRTFKIGRLSIENLRHKPVRTACLAVVVLILAFILFGGSILTASLQNGMDKMAKRFGADIMVVPEGYTEKATAVLLRGEPSFFYFNNEIVENVARINGVACASPQFFLSSLSAECCDEPVQLIAFDPATDFVIQPWIAEVRSAGIGDGQLVVGSKINIRSDNTILLFKHLYPVAAKLSRTSTGFDTSVFMNMNTMKLMLEQAHNDGFNFIADYEPEGAISAVLVQTNRDVNIKTIAGAIRRENQGVDVIASESILSGIAQTLNGFVSYIHIFSYLFWILTVFILAAVFSGTINERKKEFAVLRIMGATRKKLIALVLGESSIVSISGGIAGIFLSALLIFPFSTYIGIRLQLPYILPQGGRILRILAVSLCLSFIIGPLAAIYSAIKISKAETYFTMRDGE